MIEHNSQKNRETSTPDKYVLRIQKYAQQLREKKEFKTQIVQHIATDIDFHLKQLNPELINKSFNLTKAVICLKNLLKDILQDIFQSQEFWEEKAIWILSHLDAWSIEGVEPDSATRLISKMTGLYSKKEDKELYIISLCASKTAGEFIQKFNLYSHSLETLQSLLGMEPQESMPATNAPLFQTYDDTPVMTSLPYLTGVQACFGAEFWENIDGIPRFRRSFGEGFIEHNIIQHHSETNRLELVAGNAAWEIINQLGIETAYMFLLFASYATDMEKPWEGTFSFKATDVISMGLFNWNKRSDLSLSQKLKKLGELAQQVASLSIAIKNLDLKLMTYEAEIQPMWRLKLKYLGRLSLTMDSNQPDKIYYEPEEPTELIITAGPNDWVKPFQDSGNFSSLYEYGFLAKSTLLINPYRQPMAAALAVFLTIMSRIQTTGKYKIKTLLKGLGYLSKESHLQTIQNNRQKRNELIEKWDNALLTLHELGWQIEFDLDTYLESIHPSWKGEEIQRIECKTRPHNWLELWLEAYVIIKPTSKIQSKLEAINTAVCR
ncbi:XRE family transcriptional regulator [Coleofasciculus sp. FACHB-129]|uniref:XRE family transcriptional regulator n=1 Tax=Cyanophyceae TaxID=3028117 RepID=UPI001686EF84|nr:XRE family transcriptional regulator [Coleofasciculus sp. FACHB-129]MBD1893092.1 XRE family transcriptional regulator [Coleofasciculus sp. FACHB-129]